VLQSPSDPSGSRWGTLFRRAAAPEEPAAGDDASASYARLALDLLERWEDLHQRWLAALDEQRRNERLANAAAVYRWQLNGVREGLAALTVPQAGTAWHAALTEALDAADRGTHLLSHGYRFHSVRTICDGGLLLEEAHEQARAVRGVLEGVAGTALSVA